MTQSDHNYGETSRRMTDLPNSTQYQRERSEDRRYSGVGKYSVGENYTDDIIIKIIMGRKLRGKYPINQIII